VRRRARDAQQDGAERARAHVEPQKEREEEGARRATERGTRGARERRAHAEQQKRGGGSTPLSKKREDDGAHTSRFTSSASPTGET
jgi:hypothetical protein